MHPVFYAPRRHHHCAPHSRPYIAPGPVPMGGCHRPHRRSIWPLFAPRVYTPPTVLLPYPSPVIRTYTPISFFSSALSSSLALTVSGIAVTLLGGLAASPPLVITGLAMTLVGGLCTVVLSTN